MTDLTASGQRQLVDYGVGAVIDLRMRREIEKSPNVFAESNEVVYHHHDLWGDRLNDFEPSPSSLGQAEMMADLYRMGLARCGAVIAGIVCTLAYEGNSASVFHCGAGKDRTGLIAALLLGVAGVSHETIVADYALTADLFDDPNRNHGADDPMAIPTEANGGRVADVGPLPVYMFSCLPKTMSLALDFLDEKYGGIEGYLRTHGVTEAHLGRL
jgi:protein-tyrosine phosphatase